MPPHGALRVSILMAVAATGCTSPHAKPPGPPTPSPAVPTRAQAPPISAGQALKDAGFGDGYTVLPYMHTALEPNGWHLTIANSACKSGDCADRKVIVDAVSGKVLYDSSPPFPGLAQSSNSAPALDPLGADQLLNQEQALRLAAKTGCVGTWTRATLEADGYHVGSFSKSVRPPNACLVNGTTGQVTNLNLNTDANR